MARVEGEKIDDFHLREAKKILLAIKLALPSFIESLPIEVDENEETKSP